VNCHPTAREPGERSERDAVASGDAGVLTFPRSCWADGAVQKRRQRLVQCLLFPRDRTDSPGLLSPGTTDTGVRAFSIIRVQSATYSSNLNISEQVFITK
jgi:hypothetical protein